MVMPSGGSGSLPMAMSPSQIDQLPLVLDEEVMMIGDVGVEIGAAAVDGHFAEQAGRGELVQRVVDRGERDPHVRALRFLLQDLGADMTVSLSEEDTAERHALPRRAEPRTPQLRCHPVALGFGGRLMSHLFHSTLSPGILYAKSAQGHNRRHARRGGVSHGLAPVLGTFRKIRRQDAWMPQNGR